MRGGIEKIVPKKMFRNNDDDLGAFVYTGEMCNPHVKKFIKYCKKRSVAPCITYLIRSLSVFGP